MLRRLILAPALLLLLAASNADAFSLSPMSVVIEAGPKNASHSFTVDNNSTDKIAIQISLAGRRVAPDGVETNPEADDDFIVYPSQLVLSANERRSVRVTWAGDPKPPRELAYRIIAEQLPVETVRPDHKEHAVIKVLLRYLGALYITPRGAAAHVELKKLSEQTVKGRRMLVLELENSGTRHQIVKDAKLKIRGSGHDLELRSGELKPLIGENLLAGGTRHILVEWPAALKSTEGATAELAVEE